MVFKIQFKVIEPNNHALIRMYGIDETILLCTQTFYNCAHIQFLPLRKQFVQLKNIPVKIKGLYKVSGLSICRQDPHSLYKESNAHEMSSSQEKLCNREKSPKLKKKCVYS